MLFEQTEFARLLSHNLLQIPGLALQSGHRQGS